MRKEKQPTLVEVCGEQFYTRIPINQSGGQYSYRYQGNRHPKREECKKWLSEFMVSGKRYQFMKISRAGMEAGFSKSLVRHLLNYKYRIGEINKKKINERVYYFID